MGLIGGYTSGSSGFGGGSGSGRGDRVKYGGGGSTGGGYAASGMFISTKRRETRRPYDQYEMKRCLQNVSLEGKWGREARSSMEYMISRAYKFDSVNQTIQNTDGSNLKNLLIFGIIPNIESDLLFIQESCTSVYSEVKKGLKMLKSHLKSGEEASQKLGDKEIIRTINSLRKRSDYFFKKIVK